MAEDIPGEDPQAIPPDALKRELYFPTFVYFRDLTGAPALNAALLASIHAERQRDQEGLERSNVRQLGGWHSRNDLNADPAFAGLTAQIERTAAEIGADQRLAEGWPLAIDNMWAIINPPGSYNKTHIHPGSIWSGVYYIQAPTGAGRISFTDPRTVQLMSNTRHAPGQLPVEQWTDVYYDPLPGRLIIFPSWLYHGVEINSATETGDAGERVIISFNLFQKKVG
ncbi:TIGR02466 family protein [Pseudooceanicola nanhaiensis]|uniref:TIGR02466 family protein n=1 Tax=Pseudooceanicola nanhaiensis TaxID=375761 RepID=UPI001CD33535|nr:TIGR02466 family protein [Pseudooceanicola nanhaiensis]MCA0921686.1 hypothetical protein [Pseudooceanicola nanhaiensis]